MNRQWTALQLQFQSKFGKKCQFIIEASKSLFFFKCTPLFWTFLIWIIIILVDLAAADSITLQPDTSSSLTHTHTGGGPDGAAAELLEWAARSRSPLQTGHLWQRGLHIPGYGSAGEGFDHVCTRNVEHLLGIFFHWNVSRYRLRYQPSCPRQGRHWVAWCPGPRIWSLNWRHSILTDTSLFVSNIWCCLTPVSFWYHAVILHRLILSICVCARAERLTSCHSATDVKLVQNRRQVEQTQERVNRALMEHTQHSHPGHSDKFGQLLLRLPEVRSISLQVEEYLYQRHLLGDLPCNSLLTEMLHTKHSWGGRAETICTWALHCTSCLVTFVRSANVCNWGGVGFGTRLCFILERLMITTVLLDPKEKMVVVVVYNQLHCNLRTGTMFVFFGFFLSITNLTMHRYASMNKDCIWLHVVIPFSHIWNPHSISISVECRTKYANGRMSMRECKEKKKSDDDFKKSFFFICPVSCQWNEKRHCAGTDLTEKKKQRKRTRMTKLSEMNEQINHLHQRTQEDT